MPPELIWHHDSRLEQWWDAVQENRKNPGSAPADTDSPQTENELAKEYR